MSTLSPSQSKALEAFRTFLIDPNKQVMTISGYAGTGKTWLVEHLVDTANKEYELETLIDPLTVKSQFHFTATTNKAAKVLGSMLKLPATTVHRLLGLTVRTNYKTGKVHLSQKNKSADLSNTVIFVDEASMVAPELLDYLKDAIKKHSNCKVIFIGDDYQLPPVGEMSCPVFTSNIPNFPLKEIQRQAANSPIISLANEYRTRIDDPTLNWPVIPADGEHVHHYTDKNEWFKVIESKFKTTHQPDDLRVLAWSNQRVREYNTWIRSFSGYKDDFCVGEIMVCNQALHMNNSIIAVTDSLHEITGVKPKVIEDIAGYVLTLKSVDCGSHFQVFQPKNWDDVTPLLSEHKKDQNWEAFYRIKDEWADMRPMYAQTVHKAQGSTYGEVFIDLTNINKNSSREDVCRLVYVAITRAQYSVHLFGNLSEKKDKKTK